MFGLGVFEIIILLIVAGLPLAILAAVLVAIVAAGKKKQRP